MIDENRVIKTGDVFVNEHIGGQQLTVTTTRYNGMDGVIGYQLHESFRFSSLSSSSCEIENFRKTFSELK